MQKAKSHISSMLEGDQHNIQITIALLSDPGIYELYEPSLKLFEELSTAVQDNSPKYFNPFFRKTGGGIDIPAYDFQLRLYMILSAQQQFLFAVGHLLRGHITEVAGHIRRAIEGAGIAYLSKSKPEIAEYFQKGDRKKLRKNTGTNTILPLDNPLTAHLNSSIEFANSLVHNNYLSFANRLTPNLNVEKSNWIFSVKLNLYEDNLQTILNLSLWTLRIMERVARLLAASFDLPNCEWYRKLENLQFSLDKLYSSLEHIINPNYKG